MHRKDDSNVVQFADLQQCPFEDEGRRSLNDLAHSRSLFFCGQRTIALASLGSRLIDRQSQNMTVAARGPRMRGRRQEGLGASVIAGCDPAPIFQATEHDLDPVAAAVAPLVVSDSFAARLPTGDAGAYPLVFQRISEPVCVVTPVCDHPLGTGQTAQKGGGPGVIADLASGHEELQRPSLGVGDGVQLRVQAAVRPPDQTPALIVGSPFFARRLDAVRCAFRYVASIMMVFWSPLAEASPSIIRAKTPISPHHFQRL